jgi:hypothetical protein
MSIFSTIMNRFITTKPHQPLLLVKLNRSAAGCITSRADRYRPARPPQRLSRRRCRYGP